MEIPFLGTALTCEKSKQRTRVVAGNTTYNNEVRQRRAARNGSRVERVHLDPRRPTAEGMPSTKVTYQDLLHRLVVPKITGSLRGTVRSVTWAALTFLPNRFASISNAGD